MTNQDDEFFACLLATFREDAEELLTEITAGLIKLEQAEDNPDPGLIEDVFRKTHSLKGAARAVNFREIESVCLNLENIFSLMKKNEFKATAAEFDLFHDAIKSIRNVVSENELKSPHPAEITKSLRDLLANNIKESAEKRQYPSGFSEPIKKTQVYERFFSEVKKIIPQDHDPSIFASSGSFIEIKPAEYLKGQDNYSEIYHTSDSQESGTVRIAAKKLDRLIEGSEELLSTRLFLTHRIQELEEIISRFSLWKWNHSLVFNDLHLIRENISGTNRVSIPPELILFLERIMDFLIYDREFVTSLQHDLSSHIHETDHDRLALEASTTEIADLIHDAVLVPVSSILVPINGQIRESSRRLGKEVDLKTEGEEIEIDRRILDMLKVPLMHLVNNCIDHGIEYPDQRVSLGKPQRGTISIKISPHSGSKVEVTISDDGWGIDCQAIRENAREKGFLTSEQDRALDDDESIWLIFKSGLTTRPEITDISGRGLGLAIVEDTIARMGGNVLVSSELGKGTVFSLILPIRLATLRGLVVRTGISVYVIPIQQIVQVIRIQTNSLKSTDQRPTVQYKGETIPIIRLAEALGSKDFGPPDIPDIPIIIIAYGAGKIACSVDEISQVQEIIVRPLGSQLRWVKRITGASILADGKLALVLDPPELIQEGLRLSSQVKNPDISLSKSGRVLIVEDSVTSRALLQNTLERAGFQVFTATDGMEAFSMLHELEIDIIVSDVDMPRMNGFTLTEKIRKDEQLSSLPIILVTALDSKEDREHGLSSGANAYIKKGSFEKTELVRTVRNLLS